MHQMHRVHPSQIQATRPPLRMRPIGLRTYLSYARLSKPIKALLKAHLRPMHLSKLSRR